MYVALWLAYISDTPRAHRFVILATGRTKREAFRAGLDIAGFDPSRIRPSRHNVPRRFTVVRYSALRLFVSPEDIATFYAERLGA